MPMSPPKLFERKEEVKVTPEDYFHPHRAKKALEVLRGRDDSDSIENVLEKKQSERVTEDSEDVAESRFKPYMSSKEEYPHASKDYMSSPLKEDCSPDRGGHSTRRSESSGIGATPMTADTRISNYEETPSPMRHSLYSEEEMEGYSSSKKKPHRPSAFAFALKAS